MIIAAPADYDPRKDFFDCSAVESVIELVLKSSDHAIMIIKSTIPVSYTERIRGKYNTVRILFSPEFLREGKALYDNLYPSRIIVRTHIQHMLGKMSFHNRIDLVLNAKAPWQVVHEDNHAGNRP